jgi:hypothetical protein
LAFLYDFWEVICLSGKENQVFKNELNC